MGRYYDGDIEGKFWFGVQDSDDGEFFGAVEDDGYTDYYVEDVDTVDEAIKKCVKALGDNDWRIKQFFDQTNGYNTDMIIDYWKGEYQLDIDDNDVRAMLEWYARLRLGKQMKEYFDNNPGDGLSYRAEN